MGKNLGFDPTLTEITELLHHSLLHANMCQGAKNAALVEPEPLQNPKTPFLHSAFLQEVKYEWQTEKASMGCCRALPDVNFHPALNHKVAAQQQVEFHQAMMDFLEKKLDFAFSAQYHHKEELEGAQSGVLDP